MMPGGRSVERRQGQLDASVARPRGSSLRVQRRVLLECEPPGEIEHVRVEALGSGEISLVGGCFGEPSKHGVQVIVGDDRERQLLVPGGAPQASADA